MNNEALKLAFYMMQVGRYYVVQGRLRQYLFLFFLIGHSLANSCPPPLQTLPIMLRMMQDFICDKSSCESFYNLWTCWHTFVCSPKMNASDIFFELVGNYWIISYFSCRFTVAVIYLRLLSVFCFIPQKKKWYLAAIQYLGAHCGPIYKPVQWLCLSVSWVMINHSCQPSLFFSRQTSCHTLLYVPEIWMESRVPFHILPIVFGLQHGFFLMCLKYYIHCLVKWH